MGASAVRRTSRLPLLRRLSATEAGRVPFAIVAVLILGVGSTTVLLLAPTGPPGPTTTPFARLATISDTASLSLHLWFSHQAEIQTNGTASAPPAPDAGGAATGMNRAIDL